MGKMTSIYLTDEEESELKKYCEEHQCSQYSVLKTALREFLSNFRVEHVEENQLEVEEQEDYEGEEDREEEEQQEKKVDINDFLRRLLGK
jgi:hypothetical protein